MRQEERPSGAGPLTALLIILVLIGLVVLIGMTIWADGHEEGGAVPATWPPLLAQYHQPPADLGLLTAV